MIQACRSVFDGGTKSNALENSRYTASTCMSLVLSPAIKKCQEEEGGGG